MNIGCPQQGVSLSVRELRKSYNGNEMLKGIDLDVAAAEIIVIMGPSGSGKSVFLRQIIGLEEPDMGKVLIQGQLIEPQDITTRYRLAMVFQSGALLTSTTVGENAKDLEQAGLKDAEDKMPDELSGGMRMRVAIARALAMEPQLIQYDEPTVGLDAVYSATVAEDIAKLNGRIGATSVVVSNDRELAFGIAHRIVMLDEGCIVAIGTPEEMKANPDARVQQFLNAGISQTQASSVHALPNVSIPGHGGNGPLTAAPLDSKLPLPVAPDDEAPQLGVAPAGHLRLAIPATAAKGTKPG